MTAFLTAPEGHRWLVVFALVLMSAALAFDTNAARPRESGFPLGVVAPDLWAKVARAIRRRARRRALRSAVLGLVAGGLVATAVGGSTALAAGGPPLPSAAGGAAVEVVGTGVQTPTAFAFGAGRVFVSGFGSEDGKAPGGVYVLRGGKAVRIPGLPGSAGLAWKNGTLYTTVAPAGRQLVAWSGWNGSNFTKRRLVWSGPKRFSGLNGLAMGWDGRIYAGVGLSDDGDIAKSNRPYAQSVISMRVDGTDVRTVATGLRQPWQLAFVKGVPRPYVTVLGQENLGKRQPPDYVILARDGDDYGFPGCNWSKPAACASFARPAAFFPAHSSPTGIAAAKSTLYVALFNGSGHGPAVVSIPARGGKATPVLAGFAAPVVAVGASGGYLYAGDLTGSTRASGSKRTDAVSAAPLLHSAVGGPATALFL